MKFIHKNRYFLMMTAACVAMLLAILALTTTTSAGSWGFYLLLLLCPEIHILMHRGTHSRTKHNETPHASCRHLEKRWWSKNKPGLQNKCIDASEVFLWLNTLVSL